MSFAWGRMSVSSWMEKLERPIARVLPLRTRACMAFHVGRKVPSLPVCVCVCVQLLCNCIFQSQLK